MELLVTTYLRKANITAVAQGGDQRCIALNTLKLGDSSPIPLSCASRFAERRSATRGMCRTDPSHRGRRPLCFPMTSVHLLFRFPLGGPAIVWTGSAGWKVGPSVDGGGGWMRKLGFP